jgi:hypothetical protein
VSHSAIFNILEICVHLRPKQTRRVEWKTREFI